MAGVGLGGRYTDFRASVDVDTAVTFSTNARTDRVCDSDDESVAGLAVAEGHEGVGRLSGLRNEKADVVPENGSASVEEIRGEVNHHGEFGEFLEKLSGGNGRVVGSSARNQQKTTAPTDFPEVVLDAPQDNHFVLEIDTASHCVYDGLGLFEDLLLHERRVAALHDLLDLHLEGGDLSVVGIVNTAFESVDAQDAFSSH